MPSSSPPARTTALLDRFVAALAPLDPLAVWAHGSLGGGDYQEGRSDLDLVAVLPAASGTGKGVARAVVALHRALRDDPLAAGLLHCSYLVPGTLDDPEHRHPTWAHGHLLRRPVTPVTRRELHTHGRVLRGMPPGALLPDVDDERLATFVVRDQRDFWRPAVRRRRRWRQGIWVDLGLLTHARAVVTLREGRLITKGEALDLLPSLGAPVSVVEDVRARRYGARGPAVSHDGDDAPIDDSWRVRRAELTRAYLGPAIDRLVRAYG
ncbi:nucleotidyltransferase [Streptomyces sp. NPDC008150]|uniref:nucleotidyltransferase n=1 Tax=Streptomyces sp. NPDC008150 TaxID=3364816 RepID=UPI0036F024D3